MATCRRARIVSRCTRVYCDFLFFLNSSCFPLLLLFLLLLFLLFYFSVSLSPVLAVSFFFSGKVRRFTNNLVLIA